MFLDKLLINISSKTEIKTKSNEFLLEILLTQDLQIKQAQQYIYGWAFQSEHFITLKQNTGLSGDPFLKNGNLWWQLNLNTICLYLFIFVTIYILFINFTYFCQNWIHRSHYAHISIIFRNAFEMELRTRGCSKTFSTDKSRKSLKTETESCYM